MSSYDASWVLNSASIAAGSAGQPLPSSQPTHAAGSAGGTAISSRGASQPTAGNNPAASTAVHQPPPPMPHSTHPAAALVYQALERPKNQKLKTIPPGFIGQLKMPKSNPQRHRYSHKILIPTVVTGRGSLPQRNIQGTPAAVASTSTFNQLPAITTDTGFRPRSVQGTTAPFISPRTTSTFHHQILDRTTTPSSSEESGSPPQFDSASLASDAYTPATSLGSPCVDTDARGHALDAGQRNAIGPVHQSEGLEIDNAHVDAHPAARSHTAPGGQQASVPVGVEMELEQQLRSLTFVLARQLLAKDPEWDPLQEDSERDVQTLAMHIGSFYPALSSGGSSNDLPFRGARPNDILDRIIGSYKA